jgi:hypothetical protein
MGVIRMSFGEGVSEISDMSLLTQRRAGRSDNNEAGETPYRDASMTGRIGSMLEARPRRTLVDITQRFAADESTELI